MGTNKTHDFTIILVRVHALPSASAAFEFIYSMFAVIDHIAGSFQTERERPKKRSRNCVVLNWLLNTIYSRFVYAN